MGLGTLPETESEGEEAIFSDINITPLTDIFLVLLIIFMVGSSVAADKDKDQAKDDESTGLKVNLPAGDAKELDPGQTTLVLAIQKGGEISVKGRTLREGDLDALLQSTFIKNKDTQIVLRADKELLLGTATDVMIRAKKIGLRHVGIATQGGS